ncbi:MAG: DJ-1/PfpI family protein [Anaerolineaceae bacterium]|nr:DJ-1/PfpI family protein [Anaerolineaceae bacterium]
MSKKNGNKKQIALVVYPGFSLLELVAAHHVWVSATMMSAYETVVVGPTTDFIASSTPLKLRPQKTFAEVPHPYALLVVGGGETAVPATQNQELVDYVRQAAQEAAIIGSFSTGSLVLGAAGLLSGKQATTHWAYASALEQWGAHYVRQPWVEDGQIITGAGAATAVDMSLLLVSRLRSQKAAKQVQIMAEWDPHPPFGGINWSRVNGNGSAPAAAAGAAKTVALVMYQGLTVFDLVGPLELMTALSRLRPEFQPVVVSEKVAPITSDSGLTFMPNKTFAEVPNPQVLIVPGGGTPTLRAMSDPAIRRYIKTADKGSQFTTSVCTGALLLASVGLLQGREATTHWGYVGYLPPYGARYRQERWVQSGKIINSAGVSAGIDMALHLIAQLTDEETARQVQLAIHYDPAPPFGNIDYDRLPAMFRILQTVMRVQAPFYTRKPKQMLRQGV